MTARMYASVTRNQRTGEWIGKVTDSVTGEVVATTHYPTPERCYTAADVAAECANESSDPAAFMASLVAGYEADQYDISPA
jgi:hypothetical protein